MERIKGMDRKQMLLFPEVIDDYITEENSVRFIDAFVDSLNLKVHLAELASLSVPCML